MRVQCIGDGDIYIFPCFSWSASPVFARMPALLVLCYLSDDLTTIETKGFIREGELNGYGERMCDNYQLKGTAIAIPSDYWSSKPSEVYIYSSGPHYPSTEYTYTIGTRVDKVIGEIFFNTLPNVYRQVYPDYDAEKIGQCSYRNATYNVFRKSGNIWRAEAHAEFKWFGTAKWSPYNYVSEQEFDFENVRVRTAGSSTWFKFGKIKRGLTPTTPYYSTGSFPNSEDSFLSLENRLSRNYPRLPINQIYGDLVRRCANDARVVQSNSIELSLELANIVNSIKSLATLGTGTGAQIVASSYLSYKYGLRLTGNDLMSISQDIINELGRNREREFASSRARETIVSPPYVPGYGNLESIFNYKIIHSRHTDDWRDAMRQWFNTGLFPTLTNVWDLVPLSFVFDWFAKMEDYLDAIDANTYWHLYSIKNVVYSEKRIFRNVTSLFSKAGYPLAGTLDAVYYRRHLRPGVHTPTYFESTPREFKNYAELAALIVASK